jgi:DNA-binding FadR family transcriptional regulator
MVAVVTGCKAPGLKTTNQSLKDHYDSVVAQHTQIIERIQSRDEAGLKTVIKAHIQVFKNRMIQYLTT